MKKLYILLLTNILIIHQISAQEISWQKTVNTRRDAQIRATSDGGFVMGTSDIQLMKFDKNGILSWKFDLFNGRGKQDIHDVIALKDGGYFVMSETNYTDYPDRKNSVWIGKCDNTGKLIWQDRIGGTALAILNSAIEDAQGNIICVGFKRDLLENGDETDEKAWIIKLDNSGKLLWQKTLNGKKIIKCNKIQRISDKEYIICADIVYDHFDTLKSDAWIAKIDDNGNLLWEKSYGNEDVKETAKSGIVTKDGAYVFVGANGDEKSKNNHGGNDFQVVKIDKNGEELWSVLLGGKENDEAVGLIELPNENLVIIGNTYSNDGDVGKSDLKERDFFNYDAWVIKMNKDGNVIWKKTFGGTNEDILYNIELTNDNKVLIIGSSSSLDGDLKNFQREIDTFGDNWIFSIDMNKF